MQENDDINTAYLKMIIDWMKMTRQFSLAAASTGARPYVGCRGTELVIFAVEAGLRAP